MEICRSYAKTHDNVKVFHHENYGISKSRNVGLDNATGELIMGKLLYGLPIMFIYFRDYFK
ncbi:MAG: glycosyltransferase [Butyrivibrio sp.]|nr:glycosyltransferase [Butyrivibrio sp.]